MGHAIKKLILIGCFFAFSESALCQNDKWNLPLELTDLNTKISFEVDSTWVLVEGTTANIKGHVDYSTDDGDYILTNLTIPVNSMKTGLDARDRKLMRIIAADRFPEIRVNLRSSDVACIPQKIQGAGYCIIEQKGDISIRGITREISLNSRIEKTESGYTAKGAIIFPWASFEIEDPSILVAKLDPDVKVIYQISW